MKSNFIFNLLQGIFTLVGLGLIAAGYFAAPNAHTDDGFALDHFFYLMGGFFILWPLLLFSIIKYFRRRAVAAIVFLKENGIKGKARVLGMHNTSLWVNNVRQVVLDLNITTSLGETYTASYKKCIDPLYYSIIRPDRDLPVYIDPDNRQKLYIDFEEAWGKLGAKS